MDIGQRHNQKLRTGVGENPKIGGGALDGYVKAGVEGLPDWRIRIAGLLAELPSSGTSFSTL